MITVAVVNSKGGVGKTTLSAALAVRAARESKRVAMVDLDPQKSLVEWWKRRGRTDSPQIFEGADTAADAVEALALDGWDWVFLDGPPAFLTVIQEAIEAADFTLIPVKPSTIDLLATQDAVALAREAGAAYLCVFNDVGPKEKVVDKAREVLFNFEVPIAKTEIVHRTSHIVSMTVGKSAAEVNNGRDEKASAEIEALWQEVKAAATKAARARAKGGRR
jgi:chromosome partitioning protein